MTLGDGLQGRKNALNLVRLLLAATVVLSHTRPVGGFGHDPVVGGRGLGAWAVSGFFAISGYLICASRDRLPWKQFAVSRMLRIYPAYWLSLVAVAAIFAPACAVATGTAFDPYAATKFVIVNLAAPVQWSFGAAIGHAAHPEAWNAPLWTLTDEMCCYVMAGVALTFAVVRRRVVLITSAAMIAITILNLVLASQGRLSGTKFLDLLHLLGFFAAGAFVWAVRERVTVRRRLAVLSLAALTAIGLAHAPEELAALPVAYLVLAAGAALPSRIGQRRDLSYGLYIFGWPIQTTLYLIGASRLGWAAYCLLSFAGTIPVAWASWTFVEQRALRLRSRLFDLSSPQRLLSASLDASCSTDPPKLERDGDGQPEQQACADCHPELGRETGPGLARARQAAAATREVNPAQGVLVTRRLGERQPQTQDSTGQTPDHRGQHKHARPHAHQTAP